MDNLAAVARRDYQLLSKYDEVRTPLLFSHASHQFDVL